MDLSAQELQSLFGAASPWTIALADMIGGAWSALLGREVQATALATASAEPASRPSTLALRAELSVMDCEFPVTWEIDRTLAAALIDAQVGADEVSPARTHGVLTRIEQALVMRALEVSRRTFNSRPAEDERPPVRLADMAPVAVTASDQDRPATGHEATALTFHIHLLGTTGRFTWWLHPQHHQRLVPTEPEVPHRYTAVMAEFSLPQSDLAGLAVGDIIATDTDADAPIQLYDETGVAHPVTLGRLGDHKAVQWLRTTEIDSSDS